MAYVKLDLKYANVDANEIMKYKNEVYKIHHFLHSNKSCEEKYLGWLKLPLKFNDYEINKIKLCAQKIKKDTDILLIIGIGGSYLGARAVIESLSHTFFNLLSKEKRGVPHILYVGNNICGKYLEDLVDLIGSKDLSINVISKSGTTIESAIAFRYFKQFMEKKYGVNEARKRIYVTTDKENGALKTLASNEGYESFIIPENVGGRFSVLTAVGLLPIAAAGIDIDKLMYGAKLACEKYNNDNLESNDCYKYAVVRNILYKKDKNIELLVSYKPNLHYFIEWWKQLFGESEGKDKKGIFPSGAEFTTDLHSLGQYIQEGRKNLFETVINVENEESNLKIIFDESNLDEINYLADKTLDYVNKKAMEATIYAHVEGSVPNIILNIEKISEETIGYLIYFFELACAMSGYLLGVNPFNQPGVENYKRNMFELLGKPGYEKNFK